MLTDEIRNNWETDITSHAQPIKSLIGSQHPAWTVKFPDSYGVAIPYEGTQEINENFANARIYSSVIQFGAGTERKALLLTTQSEEIAIPFSALCAELVDPGANGEYRQEIISSPVRWWREWKDLLGNKSIDDRVYDVLGELCVLEHLVSNGEDASWNGPSGASYDIETDLHFVEVKSTIVRDRKEITISNQFQLDPPNKPLNLMFCQFEPTIASGLSINTLVDKLGNLGYNVALLNQKLARLGFELGMSARNKTFILHDMLRYQIGPDFPRITPASFVGGVMPKGISKITYTVDLSGLPADSIVQGANNDI